MPTPYSTENEAQIVDPKFGEAIKNEVMKVFVFHDRTISAERAKMLADELVNTGMDARYIVAGLRDLQADESLQDITIWKLKRAAKARAGEDAQDIADTCAYCVGTRGVVSCIRLGGDNPGLYSGTFACVCEYAQRLESLAAIDGKRRAKWPGTTTFEHGGTTWAFWPFNKSKSEVLREVA